ncbi:MAG: FAD-dependent oxidoreductase [Ardenticatenales bacterium]
MLVIGGGAAGFAAALAAARAGAQTRLVERYGFLGGMATAGMVGTVCGLYPAGAAAVPRLLNDGVAGEVEARLRATGAEPLRRGRTVMLPYVPLALATILDDLAASEASLTVSLHTTCAAVDGTADRVEHVRLVGWRGAEEITPRVVVDASGDAIVAWHAGLETETPPAETRQLSSLVFVFQAVAEGAIGGLRTVAVLRLLLEAERRGDLPAGCRLMAFRASGRPGEVVAKLALDELGEPGTADEVSHAERQGRSRVRALEHFLIRRVEGFERAFVSHAAPQVGVRESRRLVGRERLTRTDVLTARKRLDGVARAAWPIELWETGGDGARYEYVPDDDWYDVPQGCLEHVTCTNLFGAGRCMSATHDAMGSARVIGTCLAVGEAAGRLAAERAQ